MIVPTDATFASSLVGYADCQARTIGERGYLALAASGSSVSQLITILLTILIASIGYRLLLGGTPTIREGVLTLVKIGVVLAFATGWPAYQAVVYDVAIQAPAELGATIGGAANLPGGADDLGRHLDAVDQQFQLLAIENASRPVVNQAPNLALPQLFAGFDTFALGGARVVYLVGSIGSYVSTRLIAGWALALGPLFIVFLLFDATRGLVEGWLRVLSGAVLGTLATSIVLGAEIALLEPWLIRLIAERANDLTISGAASQMLAAAIMFALVLGASVAAAARLTWSLRLPALSWSGAGGAPASRTPVPASVPPTAHSARVVEDAERSRALVIADAVAALDRREAMLSSRAGRDGSSLPHARIGPEHMPDANRSGMIGSTAPIGTAARRRGATRVSASAQHRDRMS